MSVETGETEEPMTASHVYLSVRKRHSRWAPHGTAKTPGQVGPAYRDTLDMTWHTK
jgi:hypothetical protein